MRIQQFVMAYAVEQDRLRALLPEGFASLRPVLRINAELREGAPAYLEFNTAAEKDGIRGWLNLGHWEATATVRDDQVTFFVPHLEITFRPVGIAGGCPAEKDNQGCFFLESHSLRLPEIITAGKEFCDCTFRWDFQGQGASGRSQGKTLPAYPTEPKITYPRQACTPENAARIPCQQVLGTYTVIFDR